MSTRSEHIDWCTQRALELLDGVPEQGIAPSRVQAVLSILSDLPKHEDTAGHPALLIGAMMLGGDPLHEAETRSFIEGIR